MPATDSGLIGELSNAAEQLGAGQAIDLLKGMVMTRDHVGHQAPGPTGSPRAARARPSGGGDAVSPVAERHRRSRPSLCGAVAGHLVGPVAVSNHW